MKLEGKSYASSHSESNSYAILPAPAQKANLPQSTSASINRGGNQSAPSSYRVTVRRGDSLIKLAKQHRIDPARLASFNNLDPNNLNYLRAGATLTIPGAHNVNQPGLAGRIELYRKGLQLANEQYQRGLAAKRDRQQAQPQIPASKPSQQTSSAVTSQATDQQLLPSDVPKSKLQDSNNVPSFRVKKNISDKSNKTPPPLEALGSEDKHAVSIRPSSSEGSRTTTNPRIVDSMADHKHPKALLDINWENPVVKVAILAASSYGLFKLGNWILPAVRNGIPTAAAGGATYGAVATYLLDDGTTDPHTYAFNIATSALFATYLGTSGPHVAKTIQDSVARSSGFMVSQQATLAAYRGAGWAVENVAAQGARQTFSGEEKVNPVDMNTAAWTGIGGTLVTWAPYVAKKVFGSITPKSIILPVALMAGLATEMGKLYKKVAGEKVATDGDQEADKK